MKREVRTISGAQLRARNEDGKPMGCDGYAAVFNQEAEIFSFPGYRMMEKVAPGAFSRAIAEKQDVRHLMNHDPNMVMGRTKSGTLRLSEDAQGLHFDCDMPDTQAARDCHALLKRGDVDQCSFGFSVRKQSWTEEKDGDGNVTEHRVIEDVDLFDTSIVTFPAYEGTSVEARATFPDGLPEELEQRRAAHAQPAAKRDGDGAGGSDPTGGDVLEKCECDCPQCKEGNCAACSDPDCEDENCKSAEQLPAEAKSLTDFQAAELQAEALKHSL